MRPPPVNRRSRRPSGRLKAPLGFNDMLLDALSGRHPSGLKFFAPQRRALLG